MVEVLDRAHNQVQYQKQRGLKPEKWQAEWEALLHINMLEFWAIHNEFRAFRECIRHLVVHILTDNITTM